MPSAPETTKRAALRRNLPPDRFCRSDRREMLDHTMRKDEAAKEEESDKHMYEEMP